MSSKSYRTGSSAADDENYSVLSSPLMGEDRSGGEHGMSPSPPPSPAGGEGDHFQRNLKVQSQKIPEFELSGFDIRTLTFEI